MGTIDNYNCYIHYLSEIVNNEKEINNRDKKSKWTEISKMRERIANICGFEFDNNTFNKKLINYVVANYDSKENAALLCLHPPILNKIDSYYWSKVGKTLVFLGKNQGSNKTIEDGCWPKQY